MESRAPACFVALDMGTTNTRAWLVVNGEIADSERARVGIRDSALGSGAAVLRETIRSLVETLSARRGPSTPPPALIVAAGMITSSHGLAEVPHVAAPAGIAELAAAVQRRVVPEIGEMPVYLVPGVMTGPSRLEPAKIGIADVMRGEETLCVGLSEAGLLSPGATLLSLGSHWKTIALDQEGRISGSSTTLAGELLHAAQTRTILAGSVPAERPAAIDRSWARAGMQAARRSGLERALFCVRLLEQRSTGSPAERMAYLVGAFIGSALPSLLERTPPGKPVVLAGADPLVRSFADTLVEEGSEAIVLSAEQVERGMVRGLASILFRALGSR